MRRPAPERVRRRIGEWLELLRFLRRRHSFWVALVVALLLVLAIVLYLVQSAAVAPYVYPLF